VPNPNFYLPPVTAAAILYVNVATGENEPALAWGPIPYEVAVAQLPKIDGSIHRPWIAAVSASWLPSDAPT
jgi:hypothetical protein